MFFLQSMTDKPNFTYYLVIITVVAMSKLIPAAAGMACISWIGGWAWWFSSHPPEQAIPNVPAVPAFSVQLDTLQLNAGEVFQFNFSESFPSIPEGNQAIFQTIADRMSVEPDLFLQLTGTYHSAEQNKTSFANLGLARAEAIKAVLVEKGAPREQVSTLSLSSNSSANWQGKIIGGVSFVFQRIPVGIPTQADAATGTSVETNEPPPTGPDLSGTVLTFPRNTYKLARPHLRLLDVLRDSMRTHPDQTLFLTGYGQTGEQAGDLSDKRTKAVRRYLVDNGVRRKQIVIRPAAAPAPEGMVVIRAGVD